VLCPALLWLGSRVCSIAAVNKAAVNKAAVNKAAVNKAAVNKAAVNKAAVRAKIHAEHRTEQTPMQGELIQRNIWQPLHVVKSWPFVRAA
jgi:hypothetical protein